LTGFARSASKEIEERKGKKSSAFKKRKGVMAMKEKRNYFKCPEREKFTGRCRLLGGVRCHVFGIYECASLSCLADEKLVNFSLFDDKKN
jgi:hypothetical protein